VVIEALQVRERPAGVASGILDLCRALASADRGLRFTVLATAPRMFVELASADHWSVLSCPAARHGNLRKSVFTQVGVPRLCRRLEADLMHCLQFLVPLFPPCPVVATVHDLAWLDFPETIDVLRRRFYRLVVPRSLGGASAVVTNSEATTADVLRRFPGLRGRITTTPHGTPTWALDRARSAEQAYPRPARPFFLFVGTLEPRKNLIGLLEAYELFLATAASSGMDPKAIPDLVIAGGRGWNDRSLRKRMEALGRGGRVRATGYLDHDELWRHYRTARALVFPSLSEGFGLPILEAMAAGLPVMTSERGGMAEVAGRAARLVDPLDAAEMSRALGELAFDDDLCRRLVAMGRERVQLWDWRRTADLTVEVYRRILARVR
jgi:glycosyltransferase involved in cell wall biosynthesis